MQQGHNSMNGMMGGGHMMGGP
eukprot:COSAG06_NODE_57953_length_278_cov_1.374302_1_plen_21_part_01